MSDAPEGFVPLDYPMEVLNRTYHRAWSEAKRGAFGPVQRIGGKIYVSKARVDACARQQDLERTVAGGTPSEIEKELGEAYPTVARMHIAGRSIALLQAQFDLDLRALEADAAEAEQRGDAKRAADLREMAAGMSQATYGIDHSTGKVVVGLRQEDGTVLMASRGQPA